MLDELLNKEIVSIENEAKADIGAAKYICGLVNQFENRFKGYSEKEVYYELKSFIEKLYKTYDIQDNLLRINDSRMKEDVRISFILGLEKSEGNDKNVLDGYFDTGEILSLTEKGKEILNGYRLARGELSLEGHRKYIEQKFSDLSKD
jgi:hypothetical protein